MPANRMSACVVVTLITCAIAIAGDKEDSIADRVATAKSVHDSAVKQATDAYDETIRKAAELQDRRIKLAREQYIAALDVAIRSATKSGDLDTALKVREEKQRFEASATEANRDAPQTGEPKPAEDSPPPIAAPEKIAKPLVIDVPDGMAQGLMVREYPRAKAQEPDGGAFIRPDQLGDPIGDAYIVPDLGLWKYNPERNAVASGFLKIEKDGEYAFVTKNFYDRNALYIDGRVTCGYADGMENIVRVRLRRGLVPIVSVGYVLARGSVEVRWIPPGARELTAIPRELLWHRAEAKQK